MTMIDQNFQEIFDQNRHDYLPKVKISYKTMP